VGTACPLSGRNSTYRLVQISGAGSLRHGQAFAEAAERTASRIAGALLFALAAYVVAAAGWKLWIREGAEFSLPGLVITVLAIPVMYYTSLQIV
jgi:hypothetical protein